MASQKTIVLTTLYRHVTSKTEPMIEICTYKIDPRGEEYFAEFREHTSFDFITTFVNRIVYYKGEGKFIPLINSRVLYDLNGKLTCYAGVYSPHPPSADYKNPFKRSSDSEEIVRRISVSTIDTVSGPTYIRSNPKTDENDLKDLFKSDPVRLERRPKAIQNKENSVTKGKVEEKKSSNEKERKREKKMKPFDSESRNGQKVVSEQEEPKKEKEQPQTDKKNYLLRTCKTLCIQSSAIYPVEDLNIEKDCDELMKKLEENLNLMSLDFISELRLEPAGGMEAIVMLKDRTIAGRCPILPRCKGVIVDEKLAIVMVENSAV